MFAAWFLVVGLLLVSVGLTDTIRQRIPVATSALYLVVGWLLGPSQFGFVRLSLEADARLIEVLSEVAVLVSLFAVGLRLRVGLSDRLWLTPVMLASVTMVLTIGAMTGLGLALGLPLAGALLLAAVLAPTDPVLASDVQVRNTTDRDRLRFSLTGEGGLNDGAAFPFVMLAFGLYGAHDLGAHAWHWWSVDVLWGIAAGLLLGWFIGQGFGRAVVWLRREREQAFGMESFLTLGLIGVTYGAALLAHAYGFLAVFAAGLAMRHVEHRDNAHRSPEELKALGDRVHDPKAAGEGDGGASAYMAKAVLDFALDVEKLAELTVMVIIGSQLRLAAFTPATVGAALALLLIVRPAAVMLTTRGLALTPPQRRLAAWFGIRGIGSMYYLASALSHAPAFAGSAEVRQVIDTVLVTIVLSVLLHGSSATPVMELYRRRMARRGGG